MTTTTDTAASHSAPCDHHATAALLMDDHARILLVERAKPPLGWAPPAGHVLDHPDASQASTGTAFMLAAIAEVAEETGLEIEPGSMTLSLARWAGNICGRSQPPNPADVGHQWRVFTARPRPGLVELNAEAKNHRWVRKPELEILAQRTVGFVRGEVSDSEFESSPGLEPIWVWWLRILGMLRATSDPDALACFNHACGITDTPS